VLTKQSKSSAYCNAQNIPLEIEHIHPRSKGGSSRVSNLTIACRHCNEAKGNQELKDFLAQQPELFERIAKQAKQPLKDAAAVNSTRWQLFNRLKETSLPVEIGTGGQTKYNRTRLELPKTHWLDAACVGLVSQLKILTAGPLLIQASGWGSRQICQPNKYGFPIRHKTRCKEFFGFKTGDMVQATLPTGKFAGTHRGRLIVRASGVFEMISPTGKVSPVRHKYCRAIHHNDGYTYTLSTCVQ